jgi:hypothetical protein
MHIEGKHNLRPQKILIGFDIWKEIIHNRLSHPDYVVTFNLNAHRPVQVGYDNIDFRGIPIQYVPWMKGVVFVPEDR